MYSCAKLCRICMKPVLIFVLLWLLRTQFNALDEIKHLFVQLQTVYINMRVCKIYGRLGPASLSIDFTNPPYFYRPSVTDKISNIRGEKGRDLTKSCYKNHTPTEHQKSNVTTQNATKTLITQLLRTDLGWSVGVTVVTQLMWLKPVYELSTFPPTATAV